ncbi:MAG: hypothetical protein SFZ02_20960 [bacterium]|nr:hypothetical protein [bacterium]
MFFHQNGFTSPIDDFFAYKVIITRFAFFLQAQNTPPFICLIILKCETPTPSSKRGEFLHHLIYLFGVKMTVLAHYCLIDDTNPLIHQPSFAEGLN